MEPLQTIWTVGHSNRDVETFLDLLAAESICLLADVRRFPGSRRHPQFNRETLQEALEGRGIAYRHFPELGGRRSRRRADSPNTAWRSESFNAYADHMLTNQFTFALEVLMAHAERHRTAIMCAEAVPWRCHRRLISDVLSAGGWTVVDIMGPSQTRPHRMTPFARIREGQVVYPDETLF